MRRLRLGAAVGVVLLTAGGVVAAVTQDGEQERATVPSAEQGAPSLDGVGTDVDESVAATKVARSSALALSGGGSGTGGGGSGGGSDMAASTGVTDDALPQATPGDPNGPRIVKKADIHVELKRKGFRSAFERASAIASKHGGFVAESTSQRAESDDDTSASGTLVLRVPATAFDAVRAELGKLGDVTGEVIGGEDVGGQLVDLEARIRSLQVEEETLRALMAKAKTVGETIEVQQQLTRVRQELEQHAGQRARLQDSVALGTIRVNLFEPGATPAEEPGDPNPVAEGFRDAVDASLAVVGGTLVVLGYVLPLAVLALLGWALWQALTRRRPTDPTPVPST